MPFCRAAWVRRRLPYDTGTNRITTTGYGYDNAGNMTSSPGFTYAFDGANRMKQAQQTSSPNTITTSTYFGALRIKKVVGPPGGPNTTTTYIYSGTKPIVEYVNDQLSKEYIYSGSTLLATISGGAATYHHPDHLSNRVETDSTGTPGRAFGHLPYGEVWYESPPSDKQKFTSYERDSATGETGLDYAVFRYYSPGLGRFMSADLLGGDVAAPQSLSRNPYAGNDPNDFVDPLGLIWIYFEQRFCVINGKVETCDIVGDWVWLDDGWGAGGDPGRNFGGGGGGGFLGDLKKAFCKTIPEGRVMGLSGGVGGIGAVIGGGEVVYNYNTGQTSLFGYGGVQLGWNGGASAAVNAGFIRNLGDSNSNYSGPFTGATGSVGIPGVPVSVGGFVAASNKNINTPNQIDPNGAQSFGLTAGASLAGSIGGGLTVTNYSQPLDIGNIANGTAPNINAADYVFLALRQLCR